MSDFAALHPDRDTVLLYHAAIAALEAAIEAIDRDEIEGRCRAVYAATEAVTSLYLNLDVKSLGELADDLADVYGHILGCLVGINFYNDPRIAQDAIELLHMLKEQRSPEIGAEIGAEISAEIGAEIGMISACIPASTSPQVTGGARPAHNT